MKAQLETEQILMQAPRAKDIYRTFPGQNYHFPRTNYTRFKDNKQDTYEKKTTYLLNLIFVYIQCKMYL